MKANLSIKTTVLAACCCFMAPVLASTPDGLTPSEETVCDVLEDTEYGICNAYCEAMDCDSDNHKASNKACAKKLEIWNSLVGGQPIPCEAEPGITLTKTVNAVDGEIPVGDEVVYSFSILNSGNVDLENIMLSDAFILGALDDCAAELAGAILPVGGEAITCNSDPGELFAENSTVFNTAVVSAVGIYGTPVNDEDSTQYTGVVTEAVCPCVQLWENTDLAAGDTSNVSGGAVELLAPPMSQLSNAICSKTTVGAGEQVLTVFLGVANQYKAQQNPNGSGKCDDLQTFFRTRLDSVNVPSLDDEEFEACFVYLESHGCQFK